MMITEKSKKEKCLITVRKVNCTEENKVPCERELNASEKEKMGQQKVTNMKTLRAQEERS